MLKTTFVDISDPFIIRVKNAPTLSARPDFRALVQQADAFLYDETNWDETSLCPTPRAVQTLFGLLADTAQANMLPPGKLYPDGEGGLRLEWRSFTATNEETYLLLAIHASESSKDYIYHQRGSVKGKLEETAADQLTRLLRAQPI